MNPIVNNPWGRFHSICIVCLLLIRPACSSYANEPLAISQTTQTRSTVLTQRDPIDLNGDWRVSTTFSVWYDNDSGHMLTIQLDDEHDIQLTYLPSFSPDTPNFLVSYDGKTEMARYYVDGPFSRHRRHEFTLWYDSDSAQFTVELNDDQKTASTDHASYQSLRVILGANGSWSPTWSCYSLQIETNSSKNQVKTFDWLFQSPTGSDVANAFIVENPVGHEFGSFIIEQLPMNVTDVFMLPEEPMVLIRMDNGFRRKDYLDSPPIHYSFNPKLVFNNQAYYWDKLSDEIYTFITGLNPLIRITQTQLPDLNKMDTRHFDASMVTDWRNNDLYLIGGYGHYRFQNSIHRYDLESGVWEIVPVRSTEPFGPRASAAVFHKDSTHVFILGGVGNPLGRQELGRINYQDLWLLDLDSLNLIRLAEEIIPETGAIGIHGIYRPKDNAIYAILTGTNGHSVNNQADLVRIDLNDVPISNSLIQFETPFIVPNSMVYDEVNDLIMYLVSRDEKDYGERWLYTHVIPFPVVHWLDLKAPRYFGNVYRYGGLALVLIVAWAFIVVVGKSESQKAPEQPGVRIKLDSNGELNLIVDGSAVDLITVKSKKALGILTLLANAPEGVITHTLIKEQQWPHVTDESFHNSLNVAVTTIRGIIEPYRDQIVNQGGKVALGDKVTIENDDEE